MRYLDISLNLHKDTLKIEGVVVSSDPEDIIIILEGVMEIITSITMNMNITFIGTEVLKLLYRYFLNILF